jgi:hypothetical protein
MRGIEEMKWGDEYMPDDLAGKEVAQNMSLMKISRQNLSDFFNVIGLKYL